jgi:hypothetical protein
MSFGGRVTNLFSPHPDVLSLILKCVAEGLWWLTPVILALQRLR